MRNQTTVRQDPIDNIPALVQTMVWRRPADKPLTEPMTIKFNDAHMPDFGSMSQRFVDLTYIKWELSGTGYDYNQSACFVGDIKIFFHIPFMNASNICITIFIFVQ